MDLNSNDERGILSIKFHDSDYVKEEHPTRRRYRQAMEQRSEVLSDSVLSA